MIIAVDFDGTCVTPCFPNVGRNIGAVPVINRMLKAGHTVFIWTCRGSKPKDYNGNPLPEPPINAVYKWLKDNNLDLKVNDNGIDNSWTDSPKLYADIYIDDLSVDTPTISIDGKQCVNWSGVCRSLIYKGVLPLDGMLQVLETISKEQLNYGL